MSGDLYTVEVDTITDETNANDSIAENERHCVAKSETVLNAHNEEGVLTETHSGNQLTMLWHRRFAHLHEEAMKQVQKSNMVHDIEMGNAKYGLCHSCSTGKCTKLPFKSVGGKQSSAPLELLHVDLCGPLPVESLGGNKYMLTVVDDFSRKNFTYFLRSKDQLSERLDALIVREEKCTGKVVKIIRSDNGGEFVNHRLQHIFRDKGIKHQLTTVYSPQSNGIAERANRTIIEGTRTLLIDSGLPGNFWAEAAAVASYIRNACPTKANGDVTPHELYHGRKPTAKHFRVFGSLAYFHIPKEKRTSKLSPSGKAGIFVGYSRKRKAYRIYDPQNETVCETRNVRFHETKQGSELLISKSENKQPLNLSYEFIKLRSATLNGNEDLNEDQEREENVQREEDVERQPLRRSERIRDQYQSKGIPFYDETADSDTDSEDDQQLHIVNETLNKTPRTYKEAINSKAKMLWLKAMQEEIDSLKSHGVWHLTKRRKGVKTIRSKWVFKIKRNQDGSILKYKARLVAVGSSQKHGKDYDKTYSPVVRLQSVRTLLALAKKKNLTVKFYDVKTAYLHGKLDTSIVMEQPEGFEEGDPVESVCELQQGLYGLKQSGRIWYQTLRQHLLSKGFKQLVSDPCIFCYKANGEVLYIAIYVDDLIAAGTTSNIIKEQVQNISETFDVVETDQKTILGWNIEQTETGLKLSQESYIKEILERFGMENCNGVSTPLEPGQKLHEFKDSPPADAKLYQEIVGSLMYLMTGTRPDLSFAITTLSRYLRDPREVHMKAAKRTMRYLKKTQSKGLLYSDDDGKLVAHADASWNDGNNEEKSITGYLIQIGSSTVHWKSQRQSVVSLSTCQSEVTAIKDCMKELMWTRDLIAELGGQEFLTLPVTIYNDNQAAIASTEHVANNQKVRHYVRATAFIREQVELGNYEVKYMPSTTLCADALTKTVSVTRLDQHVKDINLV